MGFNHGNSFFPLCAEANSEAINTSTMEMFMKTIDGSKPLTIFAKSFI